MSLYSKMLLESNTYMSRVRGAVIGPIPDPESPQCAIGTGAWGDPELVARSTGVGTMTQTAKTRDVYAREYVRIRFGREETVREHWRSWPRQ
jgi:hypothetical protein